MKIAIYHGYELTGSGSNEYTRYLARTLAEAGHQVVLICRDPDLTRYEYIDRVVAHQTGGAYEIVQDHPDPAVTAHRLPPTAVDPVYLTDKQRSGNVKAFPELSDEELCDYRSTLQTALEVILAEERPDVLHANHLVDQPVIAAPVCEQLNIPFYVVPHGSSIEYTLREDERYVRDAADALRCADGVVWISSEVRQRVLNLYPDLAEQLVRCEMRVGIGTDTSLFQPIAKSQRGSALQALADGHYAAPCGIADATGTCEAVDPASLPGGKTRAQRDKLRHQLDRGDLLATNRYYDAYDHNVEDADLPDTLAKVSPDDPWILFVGSLTFGKGVQSLIAAMPAILRKHPNARLGIVGSGTYREVLEGLVHAIDRGDRVLLEALIAAGQDLERSAASGGLEDLADYTADEDNWQTLFSATGNLQDRVHFFGRMTHERLRHLFPLASVAVFPSIIKEASPLVFAEAMANGVLPCGSYHSGLKDGLDELRTHLPDAIWRNMGLPADSEGRVQAIGSRISSLLEASAREDWGTRLRNIAVENYDWHAVTRKLVACLDGLRDRRRNQVA